jgi:hypothetical protein
MVAHITKFPGKILHRKGCIYSSNKLNGQSSAMDKNIFRVKSPALPAALAGRGMNIMGAS